VLFRSKGLERLGFIVAPAPDRFFDTIRVTAGAKLPGILKLAEAHRMNFRPIDDQTVGISLDETTTEKEVADILQVFNGDRPTGFTPAQLAQKNVGAYPAPVARTSDYLAHPVFHRYHSETEMLRYLKRLEARDLSLTTSMIPLGSCTLKLNAAAEMLPITWPEFSRLHPFAPLTQARGYQILFRQLEDWLAEITGYAGISLQPNSGAQGEYTGLLTIRRYHASRGEERRNVCLIPTSAHGTNPASAAMAGFKVVPVICDNHGNIDITDLRAKAEAHKNDLAALMVTYPSTHGVFEEAIKQICQIVHANGGQVYMDGANLNAQVGLCRPRDIGADVGHLNLHKTFCIPHGGGGPGVGPVGAAEHLLPFLPGHAVVNPSAVRSARDSVSLPQPSTLNPQPSHAVCSAPWGSASILPISWVYIAAMGEIGRAHV
jgi:glycine dehydrogenase